MQQMLTASYVFSHFTDLAGLVALAALSWVVLRSGGGSALSVLRVANDVLEKRVNELELQAKADAKTIALLSARTDVSEALAPLTAWTKAHEERATARADAQLRVLEQLERRLAGLTTAA